MKLIKFDLPLDGTKVRNLADLREHFTTEILAHARDGLLLRWLRSRGLADEVAAVEALGAGQSDEALFRALCGVFGIEIDEVILSVMFGPGGPAAPSGAGDMSAKRIEATGERIVTEIDTALDKTIAERSPVPAGGDAEAHRYVQNQIRLSYLRALAQEISNPVIKGLMTRRAVALDVPFVPPPQAQPLWSEFRVGDAVQRMRWIEPGTFWMGSPDSEPERQSNETRHRVTLTRGYWIADTACTQALWQAVMGSNPSDFHDDPQNPVENVSWDDIIQKFLPRLNRMVPGLNLVLPTEAQWENACRAGTTTPFSFGDQVTPEQVNYDGNYPYNGGRRGRHREKTVPVKALPANQWGLYQMHGNVWEWCADGYGDYPSGEAKDPVVHQDKSTRRMLRGGSWFQYGTHCRSADRDANVPDGRDDDIGFRLARGLTDQ